MYIYFLGFFGGLVTASVGAWKDTLFEPFEHLKFFRSPLVTEATYLILLYSYPDRQFKHLFLILLASAALERVVVEGYKAILRQPPGKFKSPTKDRGWLLDRAEQAVESHLAHIKRYIENGEAWQAGLYARVLVRLARKLKQRPQ